MKNDRFNEQYGTEGLEIIDLRRGLGTFVAVLILGGVILVPLITVMCILIGIPLIFIGYILLLLLIGLLALSVRAFQINKKMIIKNGKVFFPASDVANSLMAIVTLMPIRGIFYYKKLLLVDILEIKKDGYGSKGRAYPLNIIDVDASNNLRFSSRQKRDEFHTKLSFVLKQRTNDSADFSE